MSVPEIQPGQRIGVVGVCGCGKTTLAQILAECLNLDYICNDAIIWGPNWTSVPREERRKIFIQRMSVDRWSFDGNFGSEIDRGHMYVLDLLDTVIWLDYSRWSSLRQLFIRTVTRAWTKEPMWHGNCESWRMSFMSKDSILWWALKSYSKRKRQYGELFERPELSHLIRIRLRSRKELNAWLDQLEPITD